MLSPFFRGLIQGLRLPSISVVVGACAIAAGVFLLGAAGLTERRVAAAPPGAWMLDSRDDFGRLNSFVFNTLSVPSTNATVYLLGASDLREMLTTGGELNRLLREQTRDSTEVVSLCADGFLLEERAAVLDRLKPSSRGAVVLGINLTQLCRPTADLARISERYRLGFRSPVFDEEAALAGTVMPSPTGLFFFDNRLFFLRRLGCLLRRGLPPAYVEHRNHGVMEAAGDPWQFRRIQHFSAEEFRRRTGVISRMAKRNREAGGPPLVLLEIPSLDYLQPGLGGRSHANELRLYREAIREFAVREGLAYLDPQAPGGLTRASYRDFAHVGDDPSRTRFSTEFIRQLIPVLSPVHP